jgi:PTS system N-acetylgalactosamine-specific IID component
MASKTKLKKSDYIKTGLRAYFLQNGFNYGNYQGLGYANMLYPALKKMYKGDDDALQAALQDNIEFYNTNLHFVPFITSLHLAMLENDAPADDIRQIKLALMGPLAGVGDSLSQFILAPLLGTIGASLAFEGQMAGVFVYLLGMNITLFAIKYLSALLGYNVGTKIIGTLTDSIDKIASVASMVGVAVISGLAAKVVKLNIAWTYTAVAATGEEKVISIQSMIDGIAPCLLPCLYVGLMFYLAKVKKWPTIRMILLTIGLGIVLSVLGILG